MNPRLFTLFILVLFIPCGLFAQIQFRQASTPITNDFSSGAAVVSADINGDSYDDLVRLNGGTQLCVDLQGHSTKFFRQLTNQLSSNPEWNLISGDVNNDGWNDIVSSGISDKVKVVTATPFSGTYVKKTIEDAVFFAQGSNLVDVNGDGYLDIFVCNDDALNRLYINRGDGTFERNDTLIDFSTDPVSDNSGNYGSTWTDYDLDGDVDLYIAKCRIGVEDKEDPRRINMLYVNTDTGFTESAASLGLASGWQSWSADFADIDNDGDIDILVINHDAPAELFINDNGVYTDRAADYGLDIRGVIIQSIFRDFDHDGLVDLLVSGSLPKLYRNEGGSFSEVDARFLDEFMSSFTIGDFNADGFPDVYATYNELYNTPSPVKDDKLWLTVPTDNNYLRLKLIGDGDKDAVGSKMFLYGPWGVQIREIRAGESYGIATSQQHTFGLGQATGDQIDSLVVQWANGFKDVHLTLPVNETIVITPGECMTSVMDMGVGPFTQCGEDTFAIAAPDGMTEYQWSNGSNTQAIEVTVPGVYHLTMTDADGCPVIGAPILVSPNTEVDSGKIIVDGELTNCFGDTLMLTAPDGVAYAWTQGQTTQQISVTESGSYAVTVTRSCLDAVPEPIEVTFLNPADFGAENDTILPGEMATLVANGDSVNWYNDSGQLVGTGDTLLTTTLDTTATYFAEQFGTIPGLTRSTGMPDHFGGSMYNSDGFNGGLVFDAYDRFILDSVWVITDFAGTREIVLRDGTFSVVHRQEVEIDSGALWLPLGIQIEAGENYLLTTDDGQNQQTFGTVSPKLWRSEVEVNYPYIVDELVNIKRSTAGQNQYYYFYNWQISTESILCSGERVPVMAVVQDTTSSIGGPEILALDVYPNPAKDQVFIRGSADDLPDDVEYELMDIQGKVLWSARLTNDNSIDVSRLAPGTYMIRLKRDEELAIGRFVVIDR